MDKTIRDVRSVLPDSVQSTFDDIVEQRILGASNHIQMIGEMIEAIAISQKEEESLATIIAKIKIVTNFFIATRGEASQAISNAIMLMVRGIDQLADQPRATGVKQIIDTKNNYLITSRKAIEMCVTYGVKLVTPLKKIFIYDYSSTVEKVIAGLPDNDYVIYISESSVINGGAPFLKVCQTTNRQIKFFPDAAMMYYLKECDIALMGAETFFPDGTGFNTTGSDLVALVCDHYQVPLYFITPMIKVDIRGIGGYRKELVINDLKEKYDSLAEEGTQIDFKVPELLGVPAKRISGYVTESGIIPANQLYQSSLNYYQQIKGEAYE